MRKPEKILALDMSTKTGWSVGLASETGYELLKYGKVDHIEKPECPYPEDYTRWARNCFTPIFLLIEEHKPDLIVIEETSKGSKNNFSQKILEFIHFLVAEYIVSQKIRVRYLMTGEWRVAVNAKMTKEETKRNAKARKIKASTGVKLAKDENGKVMGIITKKHVNVRRANEAFGLNLKIGDNDTADSLLLGLAYYNIEWKQKEASNESVKQASK